jgi:hypothetical protein
MLSCEEEGQVLRLQSILAVIMERGAKGEEIINIYLLRKIENLKWI